MRWLLGILIFTVLGACAPALPELPADIPYETVTDYAPVTGETPDEEPVCPAGSGWYDDACRASDLVVATTGGYDAPFSGRLFIAPGEDIASLAEIPFPTPLGGSHGTDLSLATAYDRLMVIGRDGADAVWIFEPASGRHTVLRAPEQRYLNFLDAAWDGTRYIVSANEENALLAFDAAGTFRDRWSLAAQAPTGTPPAPAALFAGNGFVLVALQLLGPDWVSQGGRIARFDSDGMARMPLILPLANPVGPLVMNRRLSTRHLFTACAGSYQARDGGLVRIDLFSGAAHAILRETSEPLSPLNVKVGPLAVTNEGEIYFTAFDADWRGHLQVLRRDGTVRRVFSGINAFAAIPLDYSPRTDRLYFFSQEIVDGAVVSRLNALDVMRETIVAREALQDAPAALRIWIREPSPQHKRR